MRRSVENIECLASLRPMAMTIWSNISRARLTIDQCPMVKGSNDPGKMAMRLLASSDFVDFGVIFGYKVIDDKKLAFHGVLAHVEFEHILHGIILT